MRRICNLRDRVYRMRHIFLPKRRYFDTIKLKKKGDGFAGKGERFRLRFASFTQSNLIR